LVRREGPTLRDTIPSTRIGVRRSGAVRAAYARCVDQVRITNVAVAHPPHRLDAGEAARRIGSRTGEFRKVAAIARGTCIEQRAIALPAEQIEQLKGTGERNDVYRRVAPAIALEASRGALGEADPRDVACLVTSSCTGYSVPSWAVRLSQQCGLRPETMRLPITEAGCAGGAVALARAVEHLQARGGSSALVVAVELCSLAFHFGGDVGNITSTLIFGDGAGAALLQHGTGAGLVVLDTSASLIPDTEDALGFSLTDHGFYPLLSRHLAETLQGPTEIAIESLLERNCLQRSDIAAWLLHPGGARILERLEDALDLHRNVTRWSWASMREFGNTSSAAIFDVLRRYLEDARPGEYALLAAFGPGLSIELMLLRASC
jgi:alkylresorcinol/alkylpyrone synthase